MFKKKEEIDVTKVGTVIGKDTEITGTIVAKGVLRVEGKINGKLTVNGDIIISQEGKVEADVKARSISIAGTLKGNVEAKGLLAIEPSGKMIGDIRVAKLAIGDGALFAGACEMLDQQQGSEAKAKWAPAQRTQDQAKTDSENQKEEK